MFSKRVNIAAAHNQVIEDFDINHPQHLRQTLGDQLVSWLGAVLAEGWLCASTTAAAL